MSRARRRQGVVLILSSCLVLGLHAARSALAEPVLHEYLLPDPAEDLRFRATTSDGSMPAAIDTGSGPVSNPELGGPRTAEATVYGSLRAPPGSGGTYRADGDTSRPNSVRYDDPFTPSIAPYKREYAFDAVGPTFELLVRDPSLVQLPRSTTARPEEDQFYADIEVDLAGNEAVRLPTVGPGTRLLSFRVSPASTLTYFRDSADNWFARSDRIGRVRLVLHLSVDRAAFGSPFARVEWPRLWALVPPPAAAVRDAGLEVARAVGVVDGTDPAEALRILVAHFRSFAPSENGPTSTGEGLYRELALSRKGVCRHRAYAFTVTALSLGLPTRFIRNEAHAWVEVSDGTRWHRIDLGGAAGQVDYEDDGRVAHVPPRDRYEWPAGADSGQEMMARTRAGEAGGASGQSRASQPPGAGPSPAGSAPAEVAPPELPDERPRSQVTLKVNLPETRRGAQVPVSGHVQADGSSCPQVRVDLFLEPTGTSGERVALGALVTDAEGRYAGGVAVPFGVRLGDYEVRATTPGGPTCGQGASD